MRRRRQLLRLRTPVFLCAVLLTACKGAGSSNERNIVGSWSWEYIEGHGRMIFSESHKVRVGYPPDGKDEHTIKDEDFEIFWAGTWRIEGDVLVTAMDNEPARRIMQELDPNDVPPFERKNERRKIVRLDRDVLKLGDGTTLDRVQD